MYKYKYVKMQLVNLSKKMAIQTLVSRVFIYKHVYNFLTFAFDYKREWQKC